MSRLITLIATFVMSAGSLAHTPPLLGQTPPLLSDTPLDRYLQLPQPAYQWKLESRRETPGLTQFSVRLTSQRWRDTTWEHDMRIFVPDQWTHSGHAIVFINGGSSKHTPGLEVDAACISLATLSEMPVVALFQVPNQPLLGDYYEDALISETWLKFLESGDETWPLLFPMVNSVVRAMDCTDEICRQELDRPVDSFVVTGASKRGWTSWLTSAADPRIVGTAPMVIDTLNFRAQMRDQLEVWGTFSEQIDDYSKRGLIVLGEEKPVERKLREMMDPYQYRERLTVPKLIINGTNDRYWRVDAMKNYWDDLPGAKNVLTVPNAGHSLRGGELQVIATVAAFARHCANGQTLPRIEWDHEVDTAQRRLRFAVVSDQPVDETSFWVAFAATRDFREAEWKRLKATKSSSRGGEIAIDVPVGKHAAVFGDLRIGPLLRDFHLSTGVVQPLIEP